MSKNQHLPLAGSKKKTDARVGERAMRWAMRWSR